MVTAKAANVDDAISPKHYQFRAFVTLDNGERVEATVQTKDYIKAVCTQLEGDEAWAVSNVLKYISRYRIKHSDNAGRDLNKCGEYLEFLREILRDKGVMK